LKKDGESLFCLFRLIFGPLARFEAFSSVRKKKVALLSFTLAGRSLPARILDVTRNLLTDAYQ
jgi:hypothetical protein